jgi:muramoyltetrapeptide carboxypeptidase
MRIAALHEVFADESAGVIWCARGGYGLTRIIHKLDHKLFARHPKCIVGFSDVTALLCWAYVKADICGLHGPVVTQSAKLHPADLEATHEWLRGDVPAPLDADADAVSVINGGVVEGPLIAANLEVLRSLIGTPFMPDFSGAILAIEEIGEAPYRIDRSLTQLITSGSLRGIAGVVVGQLMGCDDPDPSAGRPTAAQVIGERLTRLGVPVFTGAPFGHGSQRNFPLPVGARVRMDADNATLLFLEPLCV